MRQRMSPEPVEDAEASDEHMGATAPEGEEHGEVSTFVSPEFLKGKEYKPGTKLTVIVKSVNPETGEVELVCAPENYEPEASDTMEAMDRTFPMEEEPS